MTTYLQFQTIYFNVIGSRNKDKLPV